MGTDNEHMFQIFVYKIQIILWQSVSTCLCILHPKSGLEKVPISPWLVTLLHICRIIPTPQSSETPRRYRRTECRCCWPSADVADRVPILPHRAPISSHRMASVRVFHNVLTFKSVSWCFTNGSWCFTMFHDVLQCFASVSWFTMFNNVLCCLVSRATIGIAASGHRDCQLPNWLRQRRRDRW